MNNQINIIVQNQVFLLSRDLLISESENKQIKTSKDFTLPFPEWVTKQTYLLIQKYLKTKDVSFLKAFVNQNQTVIKVLRTADYLGMVKFHDKFIIEVLIPNINHHNSLALLEQSHKKLKNINDSQTWYNLLNMSIIYLSTHAYEIFQLNPARFKKLNQKIVTEVLERVIRLQRKNNFENKHKLYQLIMECKEAQIGEVVKTFDALRTNLKAKKIHSKIHAKLSWKLENMPEINQKNTKNFKYLDMNWFLKAHKTEEGLLVTLNLLPFEQNSTNFRSNHSQVSENSEKSTKSFQISKNEERNEAEQLNKNDTFTKVGVFYSKVNWRFQQQAFQQEVKIHYIMMNEYSGMEIILMDKRMQKMIGADKVELTIFCNTETIYTFLINYVFWHFDSLTFKGHHFSVEELLILIKASKKIGNFSQALRITSELLSISPNFEGNLEISQGYDFTKMTKIQLQIYSSIFGKKLVPEIGFAKVKNPQTQYQNLMENKRNSQGQSQKRTISPIPITPINSIQKKVNFSNSSSQLILNSNGSIGTTPMSSTQEKERISAFNRTSSGGQKNEINLHIDSLANSRGESRGSKRKIFSNAGSGQFQKRDDLMNQMLRVTDLYQYLYPNSRKDPEYDKICSILKL